MRTIVCEQATKEAKKLRAESYLNLAVTRLGHEDWGYLLLSKYIKPMKGGQDMSDVYEVRPSSYRAVFLLRAGGTTIVFAFFKKQGDKLRQSELETIKQRSKEVRRVYYY